MNRRIQLLVLLAAATCSAAAQDYKIAIAGMRHSHTWPHLKAMLQGGPAKFVGAAESMPELVERGRKEGLPGDLIFTDWRKMIDAKKPDIVWAFTETNRHLEVVEYCAPRKIHVIVEKPLAATYEQALAIQALARKHSIQVLTNYASSWSPGYYAAKALTDSGAIGPVFRLRAVIGHGGPGDPKKSQFVAWLSDPVQNGGGALVDFGCYGILWSLWMKGRPESVYATALQLKPEVFPKVEDHATVVLNYKGGTAILEGSWDLPPMPRGGNEILGLKGSIVVGRNLELRKTGAPASQPEEIAPQPLPPERSGAVAHMVHCLRAGKAVDEMASLDLNVMVNEVLEAALRSIKTGRAAPLPLAAQAKPRTGASQ